MVSVVEDEADRVLALRKITIQCSLEHEKKATSDKYHNGLSKNIEREFKASS